MKAERSVKMPDEKTVERIKDFYRAQRCGEYAPSVGIYHIIFQGVKADVKIEDAAIEKYMQQVFRILDEYLAMRRSGFTWNDVENMLDEMTPYRETACGMDIRKQKILRCSLNQFSNGGLFDSQVFRDSVRDIGKLMRYDVDSFSWRMRRKRQINTLIIGMTRSLDVLENEYHIFAMAFLNALFLMTAKDGLIEREYGHGKGR